MTDIVISVTQSNVDLGIVETPVVIATSTSGPQGATGAQGASGVVSVNSPITNTGSASSAVLGLDQSVLSLTKSQISDFTSGTVAVATSATSASTALTAGTAYFATLAGTAVTISGSITRSQVSDYAAGTVAAGTANALLTGDNSFTGQNTFTPTSASSTALRVVGQASQSAVLQDWRSSSASLVSIAFDGALNLPSASIGASGVASFGQIQLTPNSSATIGVIVKNSASQSADLQQWQTVTGTMMASVDISGNIRTPAVLNNVSFNNARLQMGTAGAIFDVGVPGNIVQRVRGAALQLADLMQLQTSASVILGGRNAVGQIYTGSTTGLTTAVGGATLTATSAAGTATITTTSAHNIGSGDLVVVAGITPPGFNGTYVVTAVPSATAISYVNATSGPQTVAGTISVYAQTSIVARSAATSGLIIRGAASQASNLQEWQNNSGSILAAVRSDGKFKISTNNIATTVGATGTASALPASPVGYFQIEIGGVVYKTPYYNN